VRRSSSITTPLAFALGATVALSAAGCGADPAAAGNAVRFDACQPLALAADGDATAAQLGGMAAAVGLWNRAAATQLAMAGADASGAAPALPVHFQAAAQPFHGFYDPAAAQVFINLDLGDHAQAVTIAHEIGHAFGLVHVPPEQRASLMNPGNLDTEPTAADVEALAALWGHCPAATALP
jgi:hypothetical protein